MIEYLNNKIKYINQTFDFIDEKIELGFCFKNFCKMLLKEIDNEIKQFENLQLKEAKELRNRWTQLKEKVNNCGENNEKT